MGQFGIGQSVLREEDPRLLQGRGNYVNDVNLPLQTHCYIFRSPHAHAEITHINTSVAANAPGVVKIFFGDDVAADDVEVELLAEAERLLKAAARLRYRDGSTFLWNRW